MAEALKLDVPEAFVNEVAARAAELVLAPIGEMNKEPSTYLTVEEAASLLRCFRQRVHDLLSARRLRRLKDGKSDARASGRA